MFLFTLLACTSATDDSAVACDSGPQVSWEAWGQGFFTTWCTTCHSEATEDRNGAPTGLDFETPAQVRAQRERIRARVLQEKTMPLGGGPTDEELELLGLLLTCGL